MATTVSPTYRAYQAPTTAPRFGYSNESDARKLAANQRSVVQSTGDNLMSRDEQLANQYGDQASGVEQYLDPIQSNLAAGNGGYSPSEANQIQLSAGDKSQIEWSPQDVQNLVDKAGISAGQQTAASVGAADRAAAASGGSPAALATYRARAAQTGAVNAADAETNARVAGKQAQAQGAATAQQLQSAGGQAVGNARLGQQSEGLGYYNGLQQEKNSNALSEQGLQQGAYGTQTTGTSDAAGLGLKASQTPTTTDKIIGGVAGAASAFLADGEMGYLDPDGQDAVVGENGPEAVINNAPQAVQQGASDPARGNTTFMANGNAAGGAPDWLSKYLDNVSNPNNKRISQPTSQEAWNPTTPYKQAGDAFGKLLRTSTQPGGSGGGFGPRGFAPGSHQMPSSGPNPSMTPYRMPGGLINRTGNTIDGTPSMDAPPDYANPDVSKISGSDGVYSSTPYVPDVDSAISFGDAAGEAAAPVADAVGAAAAPVGEGLAAAGEGIGAGIGGIAGALADGEAGGGIGNYLADGENGMQVGRAQVFTRPTTVRLGKSESVIPLGYRAKAKVRPSAALPAMMGASRAA